ncbi:MAG: hypothetical protein P1U67_11650 [Alcanivoracaceae bacterium]|nr:hypothetical protein [Alcanivoracaceae bacterium]
MSKNRMFNGANTQRLIVSIEAETISKVDKLIDRREPKRHPARGNRSEFVRLAIERELTRWRNDD